MELRNGENSSSNEKDIISIQDKTQWCIDMINSLSDSDPAKILLLLGRPGVGKSSFLESVTGASGHAGDGTDPVTKTIQIEAVGVGQTLLFVMDTPGINTNAEEAALTEIARGIDRIRSKARIVGVLYVSRIIDRNEDIDDKLRPFLLSFCGSRFMPQVTFVTTHWTAEVEAQKRAFNRNLEELKRRNQRDFVDKGARFYEHGREFVNGGGSSGFLHWWRQQNDIAIHAKSMIRSWYGGKHEAESPRFVQQLESPIEVLQTDAARSLGVSFDGSESTSAPGQGEDALNADQKSRETPGSTPSMGTSASTNTTQEEGEKEGEKEGENEGRGHIQEQNELSIWQKAWDGVKSLRPTINVTNDGISITLSTPNQDENIQGTFQHPFRRSHAPCNQSESSG
ncbi:hypothetical protein ACJBU6_09402 [Exserohilum turcicum]